MKKMLEIVRNEKIQLGYFPFTFPLRGIYIEDVGGCYIGLASSIETEAERRSVLAEELGHHFTSTGDAVRCYTYAQKLHQSKIERKAMMWACNFLIPEQDLLSALKEGIKTRYELADYFNVTEPFMQFRLNMLKGEA